MNTDHLSYENVLIFLYIFCLLEGLMEKLQTGIHDNISKGQAWLNLDAISLCWDHVICVICDQDTNSPSHFPAMLNYLKILKTTHKTQRVTLKKRLSQHFSSSHIIFGFRVRPLYRPLTSVLRSHLKCTFHAVVSCIWLKIAQLGSVV